MRGKLSAKHRKNLGLFISLGLVSTLARKDTGRGNEILVGMGSTADVGQKISRIQSA